MMKKNFSTLNFSCLSKKNDKNNNEYETTYESAYGQFYKGNPNIILRNQYNINNSKSMDLKKELILLNQTKINNTTYSQLICPNCINKNIINNKLRSRIKRKNKKYECLEDKMRSIHENKLKDDINNREERAKKTYTSLFNNRKRTVDNYKKIYSMNNNNEDEEYFGKDIDYGIIRCRNRELKNDKKLFGINLKNNKSWECKNCLLNKKEYNEIIYKQIEKKNKKNKNEKYIKIIEENKLLNIQLNNENKKIKEEKENKNKKINEMNRINSFLIKEKKIKENHEKKKKRKEKECISNICKMEIKEFIDNLKMKKIKNKKIDEENYISAQIRNKRKEKERRNNNNYNGLLLKGIEKKKCNQCNKEYPKNVMSEMYYSFNEEQKK